MDERNAQPDEQKLGRAEDRLTAKIDAVDKNIGTVETVLTAKIDAVDKRFDALSADVKALSQRMDRAEVQNRETFSEVKSDIREMRGAFRQVCWAAIAVIVAVALGVWNMPKYNEERIVARVVDAVTRQFAIAGIKISAAERDVTRETAPTPAVSEPAPARLNPVKQTSADVAGVSPQAGRH
ncbi:MAG: hypothetical protein LBR38_01120 [Synergistaceae bacterium]|jgi:hypothetical protein|nr:hypothetical protein [Synergistaceae bacterium]